MDFLHRRPQERETRMGQDCVFCARLDPEFNQRRPVDRLVQHNLDDSASAHLTEDGYVKHRMLQISKRLMAKFPATGAA
jgi:hypothetical protein